MKNETAEFHLHLELCGPCRRQVELCDEGKRLLDAAAAAESTESFESAMLDMCPFSIHYPEVKKYRSGYFAECKCGADMGPFKTLSELETAWNIRPSAGRIPHRIEIRVDPAVSAISERVFDTLDSGILRSQIKGMNEEILNAHAQLDQAGAPREHPESPGTILNLQHRIFHLKALRGPQFHDALNIAKGCFDYGGGYRGDDGKLEIFHHGIATVVQALIKARQGEWDLQIKTLHQIGSRSDV